MHQDKKLPHTVHLTRNQEWIWITTFLCSAQRRPSSVYLEETEEDKLMEVFVVQEFLVDHWFSTHLSIHSCANVLLSFMYRTIFSPHPSICATLNTSSRVTFQYIYLRDSFVCEYVLCVAALIVSIAYWHWISVTVQTDEKCFMHLSVWIVPRQLHQVSLKHFLLNCSTFKAALVTQVHVAIFKPYDPDELRKLALVSHLIFGHN